MMHEIMNVKEPRSQHFALFPPNSQQDSSRINYIRKKKCKNKERRESDETMQGHTFEDRKLHSPNCSTARWQVTPKAEGLQQEYSHRQCAFNPFNPLAEAVAPMKT
jgi:hypothetical protein